MSPFSSQWTWFFELSDSHLGERLRDASTHATASLNTVTATIDIIDHLRIATVIVFLTVVAFNVVTAAVVVVVVDIVFNVVFALVVVIATIFVIRMIIGFIVDFIFVFVHVVMSAPRLEALMSIRLFSMFIFQCFCFVFLTHSFPLLAMCLRVCFSCTVCQTL